MKIRRYSFSENLASIIIAILISIPICYMTYTSRPSKTYAIQESKPIQAETVSYSPEVKTIEKTEPPREYLGTFEITAYCACGKCCDGSDDGLTYTETVATEGRTIAVDPNVIPLGSIVEINGVNYVAEDIGGAIKSNRIDIFFNSHSDAREFGRQYLDVFIIERN